MTLPAEPKQMINVSDTSQKESEELILNGTMR